MVFSTVIHVCVCVCVDCVQVADSECERARFATERRQEREEGISPLQEGKKSIKQRGAATMKTV